MIELYDRTKDPGELNNIANDIKYQEVIKTMDQLLSERIEEARKPPIGLKVLKN